ncbi:hypothetical protein [Streptomyces sp. NPDC057412]|uniref:hypothetical protein n=1 Tax=Streptomyces sp. NPDC057412 TaxID=3346123 RepID=UPI003678BEA0
MTYQLTFFCRSGEESAGDAMDRLLDRLLEDGTGLVGEWTRPYEDEVAVFRLGTPRKDCADRPAGDLLTLELRVGVAAIAESVIAASPQDEQGIWGCDLLAGVTSAASTPTGPWSTGSGPR